VLLQEDPSAERLLDLAGRLDCCLRLHRREPALILAEALLETLCDHHRALHGLSPRWSDAVVEHLDDLAVNLITETGLIVGDLRHGSRWPETRFRREVAEFLEAEAAIWARRPTAWKSAPHTS
jgi:hypothetical protein